MIMLLVGPSLQGEQGPPDPVSYTVSFQGVTSRALRAEMEQQAQTFRNQSRAPASLRQLARQAQLDVPRLERVLHSQGYYEGKLSLTVTRESHPIHITFDVTPGPLYTLADWSITWLQTAEANMIAPDTMIDVQGKPAQADLVLAAETRYLNQLKNQGHPFCQVQQREVTLDPNHDQVTVVSQIAPGPTAVFGSVTIAGLEHIQKSYVERRIRWQAGQTYKQNQLTALEKDLLQCGLFASARVEPATEPKEDGSLPISIKLIERKHRTIRLGGSYVTDEQGLGSQISWEHRNLANRGHRLRVDLESSQIEVSQTTSYLDPDFRRRDLDLLVELEFTKEYPEAYSSEEGRIGATLEYHQRPWDMDLWVGLGEATSLVEQQDIRTRYNILELPLGLDWDHRDDPLNATRGWQVVLQCTPQADLSKGIHYFKNYGEIRLFSPMWPNTVLALRGAAGAIQGAALDNIPADRRFYSGGAGSVRGYAYQSIGPTTDDDPTGGLSMVETSVELRTNWSEFWGTVLFIDGGSVFTEVFSHENEEPMRWAAGLGLRYFLDFAPLRFDVAFPLNREGNDREIQFYVSIGQAF